MATVHCEVRNQFHTKFRDFSAVYLKLSFFPDVTLTVDSLEHIGPFYDRQDDHSSCRSWSLEKGPVRYREISATENILERRHVYWFICRWQFEYETDMAFCTLRMESGSVGKRWWTKKILLNARQWTVEVNYPLCTVHLLYRTDGPYSPEYAFYIFSQQIYLIIFFFWTLSHHLILFLHKISCISWCYTSWFIKYSNFTQMMC